MVKTKFSFLLVLAVCLVTFGNSCNKIPPAVVPEDSSTDEEKSDLLASGKSCETNESCQSGYCIEIMGVRQCATICTSSSQCPYSMICGVANPRDVDSPQICMPQAKKPCVACSQDSDCQEVGALCQEVDGTKVCLGACDGSDSCPTGFACTEIVKPGLANNVRQCYPEINTCACNAQSSGAVRQCYRTNKFGTCSGLETCNGHEGGWGNCNAMEPAEEICDGIDNDCDGLTDEDEDGYPLEQECQFGYAGMRAPAECRGKSVCINGAFDNCSLPVPPLSETICDGLDNDCDGLIDEDADGNPLTEPCWYGYENGNPPENCRGIMTCHDGHFSDCSVPEPPAYETLCDGIDEDCDGLTDKTPEGRALTQSCGYGYEDNISLRPAECTGIQTCVDGSYSPCSLPVPPTKETLCNGKDDDCDGKVDDDVLGTNDNCAFCGNVCPGKGRPNVKDWGCSNGKCKEWTCIFPYYDVNNNESDGCEVNDPMTNYKPSAAKYLGELSECDEGQEYHVCNGRLPRDNRPNMSGTTDMSQYEGVDYLYFKYVGHTFCAKEAVLNVVINKLNSENYTAVQVCISGAYSSTVTNPSFDEKDTSRCKTVYMNALTTNSVNFPKSVFKDSGDNYYYIRLTSLATHKNFAGNYHLQVMEKEAANDITTSKSVCK